MRTNKTSNFMAIHLIVAEIFQSRSKSWTDFSYGLERGELMLRQLLFGIEIYVEDLLWQLFLLPLRRTLQLCINIKTQKDNIYEIDIGTSVLTAAACSVSFQLFRFSFTVERNIPPKMFFY